MKFIYETVKYLFGYSEIEIKSDFDIQESLLKLSKIISPVLYPTNELHISGFVSKNKVSFRRTIPFIQNSFKPVFNGKLVSDGNQILLKGRFSVYWLTKMFYVVLWTFLFFVIILSVIGYLVSNNDQVSSSLIMVSMGVCGWVASVFLVALGKKFSKDDIEYLSNIVRKSLSK